MCFRWAKKKKGETSSVKNCIKARKTPASLSSVELKPAEPQTQPITAVEGPKSKSGVLAIAAKSNNVGRTEETQCTEEQKDDSFASLKPSVKTAKRGNEILKSGHVSGKRKKDYKTVDLEQFSNFDKTLTTVGLKTSCTSKSAKAGAEKK